tara:strand:- start:9316 stop:10170 length:855 start_codon:yes stop_codon:yes gene_type:complete
MIRKLARIVAAKWFAVPLCALPALFLAMDFYQSLKAGADDTGGNVVFVEDPQDTDSGFVEITFDFPEEDFEGLPEAVPDEQSNEIPEEDTAKEEEEEVEEEEEEVAALPPDPFEALTDSTGDAAIGCFIIVLCLTPLRRLFPGVILVTALNRHRRLVGLSCFFYACLHFSLYFVDGLQTLLLEWSKLYIMAGLVAFSILLTMAVTSNDAMVRKMGGRRWKKLHRLVYLLIPILFYHKGWAGKSGPDQVIETLIWFSPLFVLQAVRILLYLIRKRGIRSRRVFEV